MKGFDVSRFFEKDRKERIDIVAKFANLTEQEIQTLEGSGGISFEQADKMVENAIGTFSFPLGIATNFIINKKEYLVPMVIEEPSVIAAASKAAKIAKMRGGFVMQNDESYSIGQIQVVNVDVESATQKILKSSKEILDLANSKSNTLSKIGKGAKEISCKEIKTDAGPMLIVELLIDVGDAMGANVTNTMCEGIAPFIEKITNGKVILRILSNYSTRRMVRGTATFEKEAVGGQETVDNIILAYQFAAYDEYRAVTHNKGVMNGIIAVANATGQDTRAIEAAAHAYASKNGRYTSLTQWHKDNDGNLVGKIEIPMSVGIVGGIINVHPTAKICTKILGVQSASELACIIGAAGLAQNFSALRALASEGIQKGHMRLHARNIAAAAGATHDQIDTLVKKMTSEGNISINRARELLEQT
ncbi:MAG: hydroxymethylglutaryl-CoA reductase, degradative [Thaumarchaeota archaeon]|nr:hydroxymethylglutaryl-CoA reductase, degradative [Nitrososphaerota archaeon]